MRFDGLTARQLEVARLVAEGMRDSEIATRLGRSTRTVNAHVQRIAFVWRLDPQRDIRVQIAQRVGKIAA